MYTLIIISKMKVFACNHIHPTCVSVIMTHECVRHWDTPST